MAVGRGEGGLGAIELDIDAGQNGPALVTRGGDDGLLDGVAQLTLVDLDPAALNAGRHGGEIGGIDPANTRIELGTAQAQRLGLLVERHRERLVWMGADEIGEQARGNGDAALLLDLGRNHLADTDLQVGGGQLQPLVRGLHQHVVQDGKGGS